jgi:small-conductance mechanosensitive channel
MNDETGFLAAVLRELAASTAVILAAWGALGGATNALTTKMRLRDVLRHVLRHVLLGGLIAAGMGSLSMAVVALWLGLPPEAIPAGGAAGSAAYLVGVFGPAVIELVLARLRNAKGGDGDA